MENDLDLKLYEEYLNGEKGAFELLYNKYKDKITYFVFNIVKDYQKAEDITQEVFIYVLQNKLRKHESFKYYLYMVAKSRAFNYLKLESRRMEINEQYLSKEREQIEQDIVEIVSKNETRKELLEAINQLDEKYRNALYLNKIEELTYKETAEILDETEANIKNLVHRGKKHLRKILIKKGFDEMNKVVKTFVAVLIIGIVLTGVVYATTKFVQNINEHKEIKQKVNKINENLLSYDDMSRTNEINYKIIENYEEYMYFKSIYDDIIDIEENDFEKNFVFIAITKGNSYISDEYIEDGTLYIEITRDYENEENRRENDEPIINKIKVISTKISNELKRDNVIITEVPLALNGLVVPIQELIDRDNYTPEEAIEDGYVVTEYHYEDSKTYLLSDESILDDFIKKVENNEDASIRSIDFSMGLTVFIDVKYSDGIFSSYAYYKSKIDSSKSFSEFEEGDYIRCLNHDGGEREYWIEDSRNGYAGVCALCHFYLNK